MTLSKYEIRSFEEEEKKSFFVEKVNIAFYLIDKRL